ncbi:MAG: hypothetical protein RL291_1782 [Pseudomonadota bacterium]
MAKLSKSAPVAAKKNNSLAARRAVLPGTKAASKTAASASAKPLAKPSKTAALKAKAPASKTAAKERSDKPNKAPAKAAEAAKSAAQSKAPVAAKPAPKSAQAKSVQAKAGPATIGVDKTPSVAESKPAQPDRTTLPLRPRVKRQAIDLPAGYKPSDREPFMNDLQREYFRRKLLAWKDDINRETQETLAVLNQESQQHADLADRASSETDRALELRARDRQRKLIAKIDAALGRIEDGSYGYCEDTGEPIGLKRLDARPIATLSIEAQERHERRERVYRDE